MKVADDTLAVDAPTGGDGNARHANGLTLGGQVEKALGRYFSDLDGELPVGLYDLVLAEVEAPLLRAVMEQVGGNQCRAAEVLGLSRGTLRKKLKNYGIL